MHRRRFRMWLTRNGFSRVFLSRLPHHGGLVLGLSTTVRLTLWQWSQAFNSSCFKVGLSDDDNEVFWTSPVIVLFTLAAVLFSCLMISLGLCFVYGMTCFHHRGDDDEVHEGKDFDDLSTEGSSFHVTPFPVKVTLGLPSPNTPPLPDAMDQDLPREDSYPPSPT